ncbi:hypothetical protein H9X96_21385 [Pedobacter sp. N36a]|uniref:hypothetical protein n=1 Tax=Pedobacter sp. N36a TaxID=2767996 RepID=UPI00165701B0|nr:hypothetical protein [Pedobacter sp. N36a]MBC8988315.1 hypothetical protein [Pedobacter sp. N36a]
MKTKPNFFFILILYIAILFSSKTASAQTADTLRLELKEVVAMAKEQSIGEQNKYFRDCRF